MTWNDNVYRIFDTLRFPLVVLIVFLHLRGEPSDMHIDWHHYSLVDFYNCVRIYLSCIVCNVAVPSFFIMSGYLFYHRIDTLSIDLFRKKISHRLKSLCIPYLFWIFIFMVGNIVLIVRSPECTSLWNACVGYYHENGALRIFWDCFVLGGGDPPIGFIQDNSAPLLIPMWFVRDLFVVSLCSPILWWLIKKIGFVFIVSLAFCYIFQLWPYIHGVSSVSFFFFSLGILLSRHADNMDFLLIRFGKSLFVFSIIASFLLLFLMNSNWLYFPYLMRGFMITGSFTVLFLSYKSLQQNQHNKKNVFVKLASASFVVYSAHMVFVSKYVRLFVRNYLVEENSIPYLFLEYITVPIFTTIICVLLFFFLKKFFPLMLLFVNGGR